MINWGILLLLFVAGCVDKESRSNSENTIKEVVIQETKTSDIYNISIELTNNNPEFIELVEQLELQAALNPYDPYLYINDNMRNLPAFLAATFSSDFFTKHSDNSDMKKQLFDHILSVCHEVILTNFIDLYSIVDPYLASNLLESFITDIPTDKNFIEKLIKSSTRNPHQYCYDTGLPKFQELWKVKIPFPDDLTIDGEPLLHILSQR